MKIRVKVFIIFMFMVVNVSSKVVRRLKLLCVG